MYFIKSKDLNKIRHGFFSKIGGVSQGIYNSLNCGFSSLDKKKNIYLNREIISKELNFNINRLVVPNQFHSAKILITRPNCQVFKCDGLINFLPNIALGILTADCCPVLVMHKRNTLTGCIHVGWKGLFNNIIENFISKIEEFNIKKDQIIFALGPCIGKKSYQVSESFRDKFIKKEKYSMNFFQHDSLNNSFFFNLRGLIKKKLKDHDFKNIWVSKIDTYSNKNFFSYRNSFHKKEKDYGRMLSVILKN